MLPHHERIAREYEENARDIKQERRALALRTLGWCWLWCVIGLALMGESFHINATVGFIYFPKAMARAQGFFLAGLFVGTAGPLITLFIAWRRAMERDLIN